MVLNEYSTAFILVTTALVFSLPRRSALLPVLVTACYMTRTQGLLLGPFHFSAIRLVVLAGFLRALVRGERLNRGLNALDCLMLGWSGWLLASGLFHNAVSSALVYRLGLVYDACGIYFLVCIFCRSMEDLVHLCKMTAIILLPVAVEMLYEKLSVYNVFSRLGGVHAIPEIRNGNVRAQGPFSHPILAGTVGAVCLPMTVSLWKLDRKLALLGSLACVIMVYASKSSGPMVSTLAAISALFMWRFRTKGRSLVFLMILAYIALDIVMRDPAYFILAHIDIAGGSTGWYRARLIQSFMEHFSEWWLVGTDYTRHWMSTGISVSLDHTDITNHYIQLGVWGGVPLMMLFIAQLVTGFSYVGATLRSKDDSSVHNHLLFVVWAFGASLFVHAVTCISISYFDQSGIYFYITLAAISVTKSASFEADRLEEIGLMQKATID